MGGDMRPRWSVVLTAALALGGLQVTLAAPSRAQTFDESLYDGLRWTNLGPARGGRSTAVAGSTAMPREHYFGAMGGGVGTTTDGGLPCVVRRSRRTTLGLMEGPKPALVPTLSKYSAILTSMSVLRTTALGSPASVRPRRR